MHNLSASEVEKMDGLMELDLKPYSAGIVTMDVIILLLFITYCLFITFLLLHGTHRHQLQVQLAASCLIAHLPAAIFIHTGSIHMRALKKAMALPYCWLTIYVRSFTQFIIPYSLMMFSIERLIYIHNPIAYTQRIKLTGHVTLLVFPWAIAAILSIFDINLHLEKVIIKDVYVGAHKNLTFSTCYAERNHYSFSRMITNVVMWVIGAIIPLLTCLIITIVVLVMWCCMRKSLARDYAIMGEEIKVIVRKSVIAVSMLNFLYIVTFIVEEVMWFRLGFIYAILSFYGVIEGLIWILTFADVRKKCVALCLCCQRKSIVERYTVAYTPDADNSSNA